MLTANFGMYTGIKSDRVCRSKRLHLAGTKWSRDLRIKWRIAHAIRSIRASGYLPRPSCQESAVPRNKSRCKISY